MKKVVAYAGWVLFALTLVVLFVVALPPKTIAFRGTVNAVEYNEQEACYYITATMIFDETPAAPIIVKPNISVECACGDKLTVEDIQIGDQIDMEYTGEFDGSGEPVTAKEIVLYVTDSRHPAVHSENPS